MFGLTFEKLLIIGVIAVFLLGPERLPHYAQLGRLVRLMRDMATGAKDRVREEMGPDFDVDWRKLDPRQYDPRRIIREALTDVDPFAEPAKPVVARAGVNENPPTCSASASGRRSAPANRPRSTPRRPERLSVRSGRVSDAGSPAAPVRAAGRARPPRRSPCRCAAVG